jgi:hypothetical protein
MPFREISNSPVAAVAADCEPLVCAAGGSAVCKDWFGLSPWRFAGDLS